MGQQIATLTTSPQAEPRPRVLAYHHEGMRTTDFRKAMQVLLDNLAHLIGAFAKRTSSLLSLV
eukprot:364510-Chlamydomonas_euryale.AAC.15